MKWQLCVFYLICSAIQSEAQTIIAGGARKPLATGSATCVTNSISFNALTSFGNTSNANSYATSAFTPTTNATLIAFIAGAPSGAYTVTNTGATQLTWWEAKSTNYNTLGTPTATLSVWVSQLASGQAPFSMSVVADKASGTGINIHVIEALGADQTLAFGTNAIVQVSQTGSNATANPVISWSAPGNNGFNSVIYGIADDINSAADNAAASDWTEITETAFNTPATGLTTAGKHTVAAGNTSTTNTVTSRDWAAVILEIKAGLDCSGIPTFVLAENFEGTGYDETVTGTWSEQGSVDEDSTATVLQGSQSCLIVGSAAFAATDFEWTGALSTTYFYCKLRFNSLPPSFTDVIRLFSAAEAQSVRMFIDSDGTVIVDSENEFAANTVGTMSVDTTYHVWITATKGTGANGIASVGFSTDGIRPTSGNNFTQTTIGAMTQDITILRLETQNLANWDIIFDRVLVDNVQIGDNP